MPSVTRRQSSSVTCLQQPKVTATEEWGDDYDVRDIIDGDLSELSDSDNKASKESNVEVDGNGA